MYAGDGLAFTLGGLFLQLSVSGSHQSHEALSHADSTTQAVSIAARLISQWRFFISMFCLTVGLRPRWGIARNLKGLLTAGHSRRLTSDGEAVAQGSLADFCLSGCFSLPLDIVSKGGASALSYESAAVSGSIRQ